MIIVEEKASIEDVEYNCDLVNLLDAYLLRKNEILILRLKLRKKK